MTIEKTLALLPTMSAKKKSAIRKRAKDWLESEDAQKRADAQRVLDVLKDLDAERRTPLSDDATLEDRTRRVQDAFVEEPPTEVEWKVIQALLDNPGSTSERLSEICGWTDSAWHLHFGLMCRARESYLWPVEQRSGWPGPFYSGILADFDSNGSKFTLKLEAARAFALMQAVS